MAYADIAYVATAGAGGLGLAMTVWAWRLDRRLSAQAHREAERADELASQVRSQDAALTGFGDIRIRLDRMGLATAVFGPRDLIADLNAGAEAVSTVHDDTRAAALMAALSQGSGSAVTSLIDQGEPFEVTLEMASGPWLVQGRPVSGEAWLKVSRPDSIQQSNWGGLGLLADASPNPTWVVDKSGALAWANRAWLTETRAETLEQAMANKLSFDRGTDALLAEARRTQTRQEGFRWTTGSGRRRAWKILAEPLPGPSGAVLAFALDMTEAEETRDTLRRHVEAHDETLNHIADAVAIFGPSKRLAFHNTGFQALFDLDPAWLDERPTHAELLDRLRQRRLIPEVVDYPAFKAQELDFYGAAKAAPDDSWHLPDGRTLRVVRQPHPLGGVLLLFSDITNELKLRSRYNAQLQVQMATLDKLNDAVAVFGSDGRLRLHNDAFERFWGMTRDQLGHGVDFDAVAEMGQGVLPDTGLWMGLKARVADPDPESRVAISGEGRTTDGRIAAWQTRPLPDGATLVAFSDVTAQRGLEQALEAKAAALDESQLLKREFVGSVSYELRAPLTTVVGYAELLETLSDLPERSRQHAGAIRIAAGQLARSIDDVLDMAQIDAGEMELSLSDVNVCALLQQVADDVRPRIEGRKATLQVECDPALTTIHADEKRLTKALDHLLDNAVRSISEGGQVTLSAEAGPEEVRIKVRDTGRGIAYHLQAHVFDRFVKRERGGPGVAMALVKALIELHGGWAEVQSEPGDGATFILHVPLRATPL